VGVVQPGGPAALPLDCLDLGPQVDQLELDSFELAEGLAEGSPFPEVRHAGLERSLRGADARGGHERPREGEAFHRDAEALPLRSEEILRRDSRVRVREATRRDPHAAHVVEALRGDARRVGGDVEEVESARRVLREREVAAAETLRLLDARDERLFTVEDERRTVPTRGRAHGREVAAATGFGGRDPEERLAGTD